FRPVTPLQVSLSLPNRSLLVGRRGPQIKHHLAPPSVSPPRLGTLNCSLVHNSSLQTRRHREAMHSLLAFVWNNNVYIKTSPNSPSQQVTFNGKENKILNGIPDWVYEEEMFSSNQGLWWSPGGKNLAYAEFNDTGVRTIEYSWYGENQYPSTVSIPYPKPGTPNPTVKLFVVDTDNATKISEVVVQDSFGSVEHYLSTVTWVTDERLAVQWLKRVQNHLIIQIYNFNGFTWNTYEVKQKCINQYFFPTFESITLGWQARRKKRLQVRILILMFYPLSFIKKFNKTCYVAIFMCFRWTQQETKCLTCNLRENCQYNSAYFSHNASYYRMSCSGPGTPFYSLMDNINNREQKVLEDNKEFVSMISDLWYQMILPPGFDESKKYPLLIDVYAGPCSQKVNYVYRVNWSTYLASTEKIIVASFDGRGSGYQGDKLMYEIYKSLGTKEVEDQITAAREFIKMGFIDKDRVAIWGWSYGGYVTSMVLGSGSGVFKCGMAVAPVSKWRYYDSIYTERYMILPSQNSEAYDNTTVTARARNFHSVQYLLVHGTADDNVHFQQAAEISEALVEEQVDFEAMWYTDKDHGLAGTANQHVYTHMTHFLLRCFA
uniref:Dipeptidyl-peptidase 4 n=1 Tax=Oreochromis niloticus TaxID=8128 RepID=A0A669CJN0_ORENI